MLPHQTILYPCAVLLLIFHLIIHEGLRAQGHVDMVTEKNSDVVHDFFNDPLRLRSDGTWLKARPCARSLQPVSLQNLRNLIVLNLSSSTAAKCALWRSA